MTQRREAILYSVSNGVAEIRFNRPEQLNALETEIAEGFAAAVDRALAEPSVKVVVVSSEGRAFVAGGDLGHFRGRDDKGAASAELINPLHSALEKLAESPVISIGSVKGAVAGAGMSLALGLDLAIAAEDTIFSYAYSRVAASADCGASWSLPRLVGYRKALEIALLSGPIGADEALRLGLVNKVVPNSDLERETGRLADRLAAGPAISHGHIKQLMRNSLQNSYAEQLRVEAASFADCADTVEFSEAISAFFEKRRPNFSALDRT